MSSDQQDDGVVIDVMPEHAERPDQAQAAASTPAPGARAPDQPGAWLPRSGGLFGLVALVIVVTLLVVGYLGWANFRHDLMILDERVRASLETQEELRAFVQEANQAVHAQQAMLAEQAAQVRATLAEYRAAAAAQKSAYRLREQQLAEEQSAAAAREAELRDAIADVHRRVGGSSDQWIVAEAVYLTRLANSRLRLARDIPTARVALAQADQRLKDTRDPGWKDVRERLAHDIAALSAVVLPDYVALTDQLDRLIAQLPLTRASTHAAAVPTGETANDQAPAVADPDRSLRDLIDDAVSGLQHAVRIRRHDQPLQPLPGSAQEFFHNQNLQLQLTTAQLALARRQETLYRRSLGRALQVLDALGATGHQAAHTMRIEIDKLAAIAIATPLPDLGATLRALEARHQRYQVVAPDAAPAERVGTAR